ncbi:MAG: efflux RND transporter periplasmic adaptor subunit, partial [Candidatus Gastranaerophilales bacterium]|nr:efflux RND transporter periplasmic adaptor subunit [Candidatus Gastranaerophilales bacterium]
IVFFSWILFFGIKVIAYKVVLSSAQKGITTTGTTISDTDFYLAPQITAEVKRIFVKEGDFIEKNQILAILNDEDVKGLYSARVGEYEEAKASLENLLTEPRPQEAAIAEIIVKEAKKDITIKKQELERINIQLADDSSNYLRFKKLYDEGAVSFREYETAKNKELQTQENVQKTQKEIEFLKLKLEEIKQKRDLTLEGTKKERIEEAKANIEKIEGYLKTAKADLDKYIIKSPISGYMIDVILDNGEVASPTNPIFRMNAPSGIYINAQVEENELEGIMVGQPVLVIFDAYPKEVFESKIYLILQDVNPSTGTFTAKITLPDMNGYRVFSGMTVDITIISEEYKDIVIIPESFTVEENSKLFVFKKKGLRVKKIEIKGIPFNNNKILVKDGLKQNDIIVKNIGNKKLTNNEKIKIQEYYETK